MASICARGEPAGTGRRRWVGSSAALKYYPAAMVIGTRPEHRIRYAVVLVAVLVVVTVASFVPLGLGGAVFYFQHVLLPSLGSHNPDCAYDSVRTLFTRTIGGEPYCPADGHRLRARHVARSPACGWRSPSLT